jgi:hypothetical protein
LQKEKTAAFGLVGFTDDSGHAGQTGQARQESAVPLVAPPDVTRTSPTIGTQRVEPSVIADAVAGVRADWRGLQFGEKSPTFAHTWEVRHQLFDQRQSTFGCGVTNPRNPLAEIGRGEWELGLGWALSMEMHRIRICHGRNLVDRIDRELGARRNSTTRTP